MSAEGRVRSGGGAAEVRGGVPAVALGDGVCEGG